MNRPYCRNNKIIALPDFSRCPKFRSFPVTTREHYQKFKVAVRCTVLLEQ